MIKSDRWIRRKCQLPLATVFFAQNETVAGEWGGDVTSRKRREVYGDANTKIEDEVDRILEDVQNIVPGSSQVIYTSDADIEQFVPMIFPFIPRQVREVTENVLNGKLEAEGSSDLFISKKRIISKGLTSFGYDVTLADEAAIFTNINSQIIDPLNFMEETLQRVIAKDGYFIMPPNSYMLGYTKEVFNIPRNVLAIALGKSTYARAGAIVNVTPIEPGFEGTVVIEISNSTSLPLKVYANQGIAQFLFFESDEECETSYADRNKGEGGKYQGQRGLVTPKG